MNTLQNSFSVKVHIHKMPRLKLYTSTDTPEYCSRVHHSKQEYVKISKKKTGTQTYKVLPLRGGTRNQRPQSFLHGVSTHWSWLQSRQINSQLLFIYKHWFIVQNLNTVKKILICSTDRWYTWWRCQ